MGENGRKWLGKQYSVLPKNVYNVPKFPKMSQNVPKCPIFVRTDFFVYFMRYCSESTWLGLVSHVFTPFLTFQSAGNKTSSLLNHSLSQWMVPHMYTLVTMKSWTQVWPILKSCGNSVLQTDEWKNSSPYHLYSEGSQDPLPDISEVV